MNLKAFVGFPVMAVLLVAVLFVAWGQSSKEPACSELSEAEVYFTIDSYILNLPREEFLGELCTTDDSAMLAFQIRIDGEVGLPPGNWGIKVPFTFVPGTLGDAVLRTPGRTYEAHQGVLVIEGQDIHFLGHSELGDPGLRPWSVAFPVPIQSGFILDVSIVGNVES